MATLLRTIRHRLGIYLRLVLAPLLGRGRMSPTIINEFHRLYYGGRWTTWSNTFFLGHLVAKCPLDLWIYQEMIHELRPDLIIECGTGRGGSALYLASLCDVVGRGQVVTIDVDDYPGKPQHPRIRYIVASSTAHETVENVQRLAVGCERVLVILDSNHRKDHVLNELRLYSPFVPQGGYIIVEDTNLNGHPVTPQFGPGPMEAVEAFLQEQDDFVIDTTKEKFFLTFNPRGYLKRVATRQAAPQRAAEPATAKAGRT